MVSPVQKHETVSMKTIFLSIFALSALFNLPGEQLTSRLDLNSSTEVRIELPGIPLRVAGELLDGVPIWLVRMDDSLILEINPGDGAGYRVINQEDAEVLNRGDHEPPTTANGAREERNINYGDYKFILEKSGDFQLSTLGSRVVIRGKSLPDALPSYDGKYLVILTDASNDYRHGILGDKIEPSGFTLFRISGGLQSMGRYKLPRGSVFETLRPTLTDINGDGVPEILLTVSNAGSGAAIRAYSPDGSQIAESPAIGLGNRWTHLLGAAGTGPQGELEIITVRTPHIGGSLEYYRLRGDRLELIHQVSGYSTHSIGSRNLDMALIGDFGGNSRPDVLLPTQDFRSLVVVERTERGSREIWRTRLGSRLTTNLGLLEKEGKIQVAWGTEDGVLHIRKNP